MTAARLGASLTGHRLALDAVLRLARDADALGYAVLLLDGDASLLPRRPQSPIHDPTALLAAALTSTARVQIGSIRLPVYWNAALLARSLATLQELSEGRSFAFVGAGHGRHEASLGLPDLDASGRLDRLEELLEALRALLAGELVTRSGRHVQLDRVRVTPPRQPLSVVVPAARPRALRIAQQHGDVLDANVPPLPEKLDPLRQRLTRSLPIWIWVFARPGLDLDAAAREYRRHAPWFRDLSEREVSRAVLFGEPERCRDRLAELRAELAVDLPILDLAGLDEAGARAALEAFAPAKAPRMA